MFALVFVIFDVEAVFLYPWAVAFHRLGLFAFVDTTWKVTSREKSNPLFSRSLEIDDFRFLGFCERDCAVSNFLS